MSKGSFWQKGLTGAECIAYHYSRKGVKQVLDKFKIFHFVRAVKSSTVIKAMLRDGYIPAGLTLLREFSCAFRESLPEGMSIIALSECVNLVSGEVCICKLIKEGSIRSIYYSSPQKKWPKGYYFLGVLESALPQEPETYFSETQKAYKTCGRHPN